LRYLSAMPWEFAHLWDVALSYDRFVKESTGHCELWTGVYRTARVPPWATERAAELGRRFRLVVLAEDWCGDASSTVPVIERWAEQAGNIELRILRRDEYSEVMDRYLTDGTRSIPLVIVLTEEMEEIGRWGPRPAVLQAFVTAERKTRASQAYYPDVRRWYARDKGESTLREILEVMARAPARR
jgi:hypothetical protein